jgi:hypothetical protein
VHPDRHRRGARKRAATVRMGATELRVMSLEDILKSKRAANRPKDRAVLPVLETTLRAKTPRN